MKHHTFAPLLALFVAGSASAAFVGVPLPGNTDFDGWEGFHSTNQPGYGSYPGTAAWPAPIGSDTAGSGDAALNKIAGSGYPSTTDGAYYIYSTLAGANAANTSPDNVVGTFSLADTTPVDGLQTIVFQISISYWSSVGTPFPTGTLPVLNYNGGTQSLEATHSLLAYSGEFDSPFGTASADFWAFQWDLSDIDDPIDSFEVIYSVTNHAQTYALRLDQGDTYAQVIPEPASTMLGSIAAALFVLRRRKP